MDEYWKFETSPDVIDKKCACCGVPMRYDRASAVRYKGDNAIYHYYCLLSKLAKYHYDMTIPPQSQGEWAYSP